MITIIKEKILLTGFYPLEPCEYSPTQEIVRDFDNKMIGDRNILSLVLPCSYYRDFELLSGLVNIQKPYAIVHLGLASSAQCIRIEKRFHNIMNGKYPDINGLDPQGEPIVKDGDPFLEPNDSHTRLADLLKGEGIRTEMSNDATGFVCNSLGYLTAKKIKDENLPTKQIFMHIPWTDDYKSRVKISSGKVYLSKDILYKALNLIFKNI